MRVSPSKRQRLAADAQHADQRQSMTTSEFRDASVGYLSSRLVDSHGPQAATLQLRPSLQKVHDDLVAVLDSAVQLKQNASLLVIGEPGIGKTMVSENGSNLDNRSCRPTAHAQPRVAAWLQCREQ
jgi:ABC-type microcin C transport system duplicated ATPase subunit YejF